MLEMVGDDTDTRTLSRYFQQFDEIAKNEAERGATQQSASQKKQVVMLLERFLEKEDLSGRLKKEAQGLLDAINLQ